MKNPRPGQVEAPDRSPVEAALLRVLIVDDHQLFAEAIRGALIADGIQVVGVATNKREALELALCECPDLVVMDLMLPDANGIDLGGMIKQQCPQIKILILTALKDPRTLKTAMGRGFHGYLTKDTPIDRFVASIRTVLNGEVIIPYGLSTSVAGGRSIEEQSALLRADQLTRRERQVLRLLVQGASSEEISSHLGVSPHTVRTHVQNVLTKLQVKSRLGAAAFAVKHRLVDQHPV